MRIDYSFATTAARVAKVWDLTDRGAVSYDSEDGELYVTMSSGAGHATMRPLTNGTGQRSIPISLNDFRIVSSGGDVGNIAAIGGVLASDTVPILRGDSAETVEINWASSQSIIIGTQFDVPTDFDGRRDCAVQITGASGTTNSFDFTVETGWDGAALVSDSAVGQQSASNHTATATIAAGDIPDKPTRCTLMLTPAAHTTNAFNMVQVRFLYYTGG